MDDRQIPPLPPLPPKPAGILSEEHEATQEMATHADGSREMKPEDIQRLRFYIEFVVLPNLFYHHRDDFVSDLLADRGRELCRIYSMAARPAPSPYAPEDFNVQDLGKVQGMRCVLIEMPERDIRVTLCHRIYLVWHTWRRKCRYYTVEESLSYHILGRKAPNGEHDNYGVVAQEEELDRIKMLFKGR